MYTDLHHQRRWTRLVSCLNHAWTTDEDNFRSVVPIIETRFSATTAKLSKFVGRFSIIRQDLSILQTTTDWKWIPGAILEAIECESYNVVLDCQADQRFFAHASISRPIEDGMLKIEVKYPVRYPVTRLFTSVNEWNFFLFCVQLSSRKDLNISCSSVPT